MSSTVVEYLGSKFFKSTAQQRALYGTLAAIAIYVVYNASLSIYRLYFHPLAKFPGPKAAALSKNWLKSLHNNQLGYPEKEFEALHKKYNSQVLRIAPNELHISDVHLYKTIYSQQKPYLKSEFYHTFQVDGTLFAERLPELHKQRRKMLNPLFSAGGVRTLEPVITQTIEKFMAKIKRISKKGPVNVYDAYRCVTGDVISSFAFGQSLGLMDESPDSFQADFLDASNTIGAALWVLYFSPIASLFVRIIPMALAAKFNPEFEPMYRIHKIARESVQEYKRRSTAGQEKTKASHPLIYDHLSSLKDNAQALEAVDILLAGSDTTAYTLCHATWHITRNAAIKKKLMSVLEEAIPNPGQMPSWVELDKIPYLYGCVKESLRIAIPTPCRLPRIVPAGKEPLVVDGLTVPPGAIVGMSAYTMNTSTELWGEDAHVFNPERWLVEGGASLNNHLGTFSKGARQCIGINVAHAELTLILARLFRNFDINVRGDELSPIKDYFNASFTTHKMEVDFHNI